MPSFRVNGSCTRATYQRGTLVLYHPPSIYNLQAPLKCAQIDEMSIGQCHALHIHMKDKSKLVLQPIHMKDKSKLVLQPMSDAEEAAFHAAHKLKLRALQQKYAKQAMNCAKIIQAGAKKLIRIQNRMKDEAAEIAGDSYRNYHIVSYALHGTNAEQVELDGFVTTPDFASVKQMAGELVATLAPVITAKHPPGLLREFVEHGSE
jgi:hypothetical protein